MVVVVDVVIIIQGCCCRCCRCWAIVHLLLRQLVAIASHSPSSSPDTGKQAESFCEPTAAAATTVTTCRHCCCGRTVDYVIIVIIIIVQTVHCTGIRIDLGRRRDRRPGHGRKQGGSLILERRCGHAAGDRANAPSSALLLLLLLLLLSPEFLLFLCTLITTYTTTDLTSALSIGPRTYRVPATNTTHTTPRQQGPYFLTPPPSLSFFRNSLYTLYGHTVCGRTCTFLLSLNFSISLSLSGFT